MGLIAGSYIILPKASAAKKRARLYVSLLIEELIYLLLPYNEYPQAILQPAP